MNAPRQYTSGSNGKPKGVILTRANLLANIRSMSQAARIGRDDLFASWLPLNHDMELNTIHYPISHLKIEYILSYLCYIQHILRFLMPCGSYWSRIVDMRHDLMY